MQTVTQAIRSYFIQKLEYEQTPHVKVDSLPFIHLRLQLKILDKIESCTKLGPGHSNGKLRLGSVIRVLKMFSFIQLMVIYASKLVLGQGLGIISRPVVHLGLAATDLLVGVGQGCC